MKFNCAAFALGLALWLPVYAQQPSNGASAVVASSQASAPQAASIAFTAAVQTTALHGLSSKAEAGWWDNWGKTALGTFLGAALALGSAVWQRRRHERQVNIVAGNLAIFQLRVMYRQTAQLREAVRRQAALMRRVVPDAPVWALLKPMLVSPEDVTFDFEALAFLLSSARGREALLRLKTAEQEYAHQAFALSELRKTLQDVQAAAAPLLLNDGEPFPEELEARVGPALVAASRSLVVELMSCVERSPELHRAAFAAIDDELKQRFGEAVWDVGFELKPDSSWHEDRLEPIPDDLNAQLNRWGGAL